jgi:hypothetical protein
MKAERREAFVAQAGAAGRTIRRTPDGLEVIA